MPLLYDYSCQAVIEELRDEPVLKQREQVHHAKARLVSYQIRDERTLVVLWPICSVLAVE